ncbi:NF-X1-type zinc finger protein NFXL1 [Anopheles ziemanni]|uniref:NF-X1-type zinc finger protein NFXL1 n=1 Tax=Anopheles coustani TaxID=139045 RepID=UPI00265A3344|nr:NF-X1-type zinc finger protein NFXL1 [Anopheles coustani]XP_058177149.1 NF-X1-type zinc finger protein NFXL1 [Anopheles ziemanni]
MANRNRKFAPKEQNVWKVPVEPNGPAASAGGGGDGVKNKPQKPAKTASPADDNAVSGSKIPVSRTATSMIKKSQEKFNQVQRQHAETARKYATEYVSSDEDDDGTTGGASDASTQAILGDVLKNYHGIDADVGRTQEYLQNLLESRNAVCLICIETVKRADKIWSCHSCYTFFHLMCIQRWANDSMSMKRINHEQQEGYYNNRGEYIPKPVLSVHWDCPKCRKEYQPQDIPRHYECFCRKEQNPSAHPWLIPHSCGEPCEKNLNPECGHTCRLLCHPGPCPPCPQTISVSCRCGSSALKTIRCSQKSWTCVKKCTRKLSCGIHECGAQCHEPGKCPPCKNRSKQQCLCGAKTKEVNCHESRWQCGTVCNKPFPCSIHKCELKCHDGPCGECPLGLPRSCPCGKTETRAASCSERIGTCGDTCQKVLECGQHHCTERCHQGPCGSCLVLVGKVCRCGATTKEVGCHREATCESKCKKVRTCGKHPCNRKCCDGQCPECDKVCGKTLPCGKHKCTSLCHQGLCYPCNQKSAVKCRCGGTSIEVQCGREKKANAPKCKLPCRIHSKCHHQNPHDCHQGECPPCTQLCGQPNDTTNCEHPCEARCHAAVKVVTKDKNFKPVGPWDVPQEVVEIKTLPHPPCPVKVPVMCLGGHETADWPCSNSKPSSCGRACGRKLRCGLHQCPLICHKVTHRASTTQDSRCEACTAGCAIPRPTGCVHPCQRACHNPPCNPCQVAIKTNCYCGLTQVFYKCHEFYPPDLDGKEKGELVEALKQRRASVMSCGQKCIKNLPCGHRCSATCHPGRCPNPELCAKKVKITCKCGHRKAEVNCNAARVTPTLGCDDQCTLLQERKRAELEKQQEEERARQAIENQKELEEYERKFNRRKHRERKRQEVEQEEGGRSWMYLLPVAVVLIAIAVYFLMLQ